MKKQTDMKSALSALKRAKKIKSPSAKKLSRHERMWPHSDSEKTDAPDYQKVGGFDYFRFSGRSDTIHFSEDRLFCGKAGLSNNYARLKPNGIICPVCKKKAMKISRAIKAAQKASAA